MYSASLYSLYSLFMFIRKKSKWKCWNAAYLRRCQSIFKNPCTWSHKCSRTYVGNRTQCQPWNFYILNLNINEWIYKWIQMVPQSGRLVPFLISQLHFLDDMKSRGFRNCKISPGLSTPGSMVKGFGSVMSMSTQHLVHQPMFANAFFGVLEELGGSGTTLPGRIFEKGDAEQGKRPGPRMSRSKTQPSSSPWCGAVWVNAI